MINGCGGCQPPKLVITKAEWSTVTKTTSGLTFGYVHLHLAGQTNGYKVTVLTYGDGLLNETELKLDKDKKFDEDVIIAFTHAPQSVPFQRNTRVKAYFGNKVKEVTLQSGVLKY